VYFAKEEVNNDREGPEEEVVNKVVHRCQLLPTAPGSFRRHDEELRLRIDGIRMCLEKGIMLLGEVG
jgi:hypothetical protein